MDEKEFREGKPAPSGSAPCQHQRREWHVRGGTDASDVCMDCHQIVPALASTLANFNSDFQVPKSPASMVMSLVESPAAKLFDAKATGAFVEGVHKDAALVDNDAHALGVQVIKVQAEVAALAAEALRIRDSALKQLDALKQLASYDNKEAEVHLKAARYDELQALIDEELVTKRGWIITSARDAVFQLYNDNVFREANEKAALRANVNLNGALDEAKASIENLEVELRYFKNRAAK